MYHHTSDTWVTTPPVGQESGHGLAGSLWLRVTPRLWWRCGLDCDVILRLPSGRICFQVYSLRGYQASGPADCWLETSAPCHVGPPSRAAHGVGAVFPPSKGAREGATKTHLILELRFHHLCHILLSRNSPELQPTLKGEDYTMVWILGVVD